MLQTNKPGTTTKTTPPWLKPKAVKKTQSLNGFMTAKPKNKAHDLMDKMMKKGAC